ncbi:MAG: tRNA-dihydrouridine synthase [Patescibacteria group bacterium]|jgi:tRNA-dihydrouridine synthase B|nr:tRNA-dihydrouridine synthase [Patescibacteria group bacterium]
MHNFWEQFDDSILALAPMAGISDSAFRQICASYGADVLYSEMASVDALFYSSQKTIEMLYFTEIERPYVIQLFGTNPEYFEKAVKLLDKEINPDGYDINFGCPVQKVIKQGAGAALMANLSKSKDVVKAVLSSTDKPLSVKTRTKSGDVDVISFVENINYLNVSAIMVHGRTFRQGFSGEIDFDSIKKVREIFRGKVIANGGISNRKDAKEILIKTGADGIGLARGIMGRPWLFEEIKKDRDILKTKAEIFEVALYHSKIMHSIAGDRAIPELRKHLSWYMHGLEGASELRLRAVRVETMNDIESLLRI